MNPQPIQDRLQMAQAAVRFGDGELAWEILSRIAGRCTYTSMMTQRYEDGKTFVLDANGAIPEIVNQMLVQSRAGGAGEAVRIELLPALPKALAQGGGEIRGIAARGQIVIDRLKWGKEGVNLEMTSARDQTVEVRYGEEARKVELKTGRRAAMDCAWKEPRKDSR